MGSKCSGGETRRDDATDPLGNVTTLPEATSEPDTPPRCNIANDLIVALAQLGLLLHVNPDRWVALPQLLSAWARITGAPLEVATIGFLLPEYFFVWMEEVHLVCIDRRDDIMFIRPRDTFWLNFGDIAQTAYHPDAGVDAIDLTRTERPEDSE